MDSEYLNRFEKKLQDGLLQICISHKALDNILLESEDIDNKWKDIAPEYLADAVGQVNDYPTVSVAWAAYLGMAIAYGWDKDWTHYSKMTYRSFYGERGFDDMDDNIVKNILHIDPESKEAGQIESIIRTCAQATVSFIRHEQIEPQSPMAYHAFIKACKAMFKTGAAIELKRLGYKMEKIQ